MLECKICNNNYKNYIALAKHIRITHNISSQEYYDLFFKQENDGKCEICGKLTKFRRLSNGYNKFCSNKCAGQSELIKEKIKETCLKKYGTDNYSKTNEYLVKRKETSLEKYGLEDYSKTNEFKERLKTTCLEKYGVTSYTKTDECKEKIKETSIKKYNANHYSESIEYSKKRKSATSKKYEKILNDKKLGKINLHNKYFVNYHCNICNNDCIINFNTFRARLLYCNTNPCLICNPLEKQYSEKETEILKYIKSFYIEDIIENDKNVLNGLELDIYIPKLKIGIEFDGTYWHADKRFYNKDDKINFKYTAEEIWKHDAYKDYLCENKNIKLIRIKEYDYDINKNEIFKKLRNIIDEVNK